MICGLNAIIVVIGDIRVTFIPNKEGMKLYFMKIPMKKLVKRQ